MTILSEIINSLELTTIKLFFTSSPEIFSYLNMRYSNSLASVFALVNASNISTCFGDFPGFLRPSLSDNNKVAYIKAVDIRSTYTRHTCARHTDVGDIFFARNACIKGSCAVKCSKIHLQLS